MRDKGLPLKIKAHPTEQLPASTEKYLNKKSAYTIAT
jgi:hypothetical protein